MDIEPLWALGGWLFLFFDCMAAPKTLSETYAKPQSLLLFLTLFFIFLLLIHPTNPVNSSNVSSSSSSSIPFRRRLLATSSKSTSYSTNHFRPKQTHNAHTSSSSSSPSSSSSASSKPSRREFGAKAHEVPSGPNPISNR
ncbi:PREDICTED: CLAVATA3/ESR (CLE)-related protein 44 [Theobroma cacao]|uniref:CLAVATA3/ESR (CLE)-related protein 44 n=1 Tax=Theobroma cacao TaxID=3641 RepID=A0AB32VQC4_THECC|nr:PREDICTED: CLAVATA3/ESR (CLE)-related protein 44 [Theobroma cacao]